MEAVTVYFNSKFIAVHSSSDTDTLFAIIS